MKRVAEDGEAEILKWLPVYGIVGVSLISGWVGVLMARKIFVHKETRVNTLVCNQ